MFTRAAELRGRARYFLPVDGLVLTLAFLSPECPWKVRVGATPRSSADESVPRRPLWPSAGRQRRPIGRADRPCPARETTILRKGALISLSFSQSRTGS